MGFPSISAATRNDRRDQFDGGSVRLPLERRQFSQIVMGGVVAGSEGQDVLKPLARAVVIALLHRHAAWQILRRCMIGLYGESGLGFSFHLVQPSHLDIVFSTSSICILVEFGVK